MVPTFDFLADPKFINAQVRPYATYGRGTPAGSAPALSAPGCLAPCVVGASWAHPCRGAMRSAALHAAQRHER